MSNMLRFGIQASAYFYLIYYVILYFNMDAITIIIIITAIVNLFLGYFIATRGTKNWSSYSLSLFSFMAGIWGVSFYFYTYPVLFSSLVWMKIILVEVFLMIASFFYFSFIFPRKLRFSSFFLVFYWLIATPIILHIFFTDTWIKDVVLRDGKYYSILGSNYKYFGIFIWSFALWSCGNLISQYKKSTGILKTQLVYVILGGLLYGIFVSIPDIIIPLFLIYLENKLKNIQAVKIPINIPK